MDITDRDSFAYWLMMKAGYKIKAIASCREDKQYRVGDPVHQIHITLHCVCGGIEEWADLITGEPPKKIDAALKMEQLGVASVEHLTEDGFNAETIAAIRRPYDNREAEYQLYLQRDASWQI